jgi:hypothetical protein
MRIQTAHHKEVYGSNRSSLNLLSIKRISAYAVVFAGLLWVPAAHAELGKSYRDAERLSVGEKLTLSDNALDSMKDTLKYTLKELRSAFEQKDSRAIHCVRSELSTVKGLLRISEEAHLNLKEASVTNQIDLVNHEYVKIKMAAERVKELKIKVTSCSKSVNNPLTRTQNLKSKPEISDSAVQQFTPTADESTVIIYDPIATERPEAVSSSE